MGRSCVAGAVLLALAASAGFAAPKGDGNVYDAFRKLDRSGDGVVDLSEAIKGMKKDPLIRTALGDHIYQHFVEAKMAAWREYNASVHEWELERYLARY